MRNATNEELAYCAGVIDSDGSISVRRSRIKDKVTKRLKIQKSYISYREWLMVGQIEPQAVFLFKELFEGSISIRKRQGYRDIYIWRCISQKAHRCINLLRPFLRIKTAQADNAISFRKVMNEVKLRNRTIKGLAGTQPRSEKDNIALDKFANLSLELNRSGVRTKKEVLDHG